MPAGFNSPSGIPIGHSCGTKPSFANLRRLRLSCARCWLRLSAIWSLSLNCLILIRRRPGKLAANSYLSATFAGQACPRWAPGRKSRHGRPQHGWPTPGSFCLTTQVFYERAQPTVTARMTKPRQKYDESTVAVGRRWTRSSPIVAF